MDMPSSKPTDVSFVGNRIFIPGDIMGCGRYRIKIDARVAVTPTDIQPERAYYFVTIEEYEKTEVCNKDIQNYQIYLPLDKPLLSISPFNTWLLNFTGHKDIVPKVVNDLFKDDPQRYAPNLVTTNNILNVHFDNIPEKEDALAKIIFGDGVTPTVARPERVDIILNQGYLVGDSAPEHFVTKA